MDKALILIVDDTPDNLDVLGGILGKEYKVKVALNGERALRIAHGTPRPDMILLDVIMPDIDGYEVCRRLKADPITANIPIIFVTAKAKAEDERLGLELGAVDYITKPISPPIVELRVRTQLALYDQNRELERRVAERTKELSDTIQQLRETTAAKERIESELAIAGQIQRAMLPKTDLTDAVECGYRLSAFLQPARQVGGDLYDFFLLDTGWLCLAIGDVSDKGVPAALTMARVITLIRAIAKLNSTPAAILEAINIALCHENDDCHFVTLLCGILEISTGTLHYASGGHDAPLLLRNKHNSWIQLETGPALGIFPNASFPNQRIQLEANDLLLFFTDGLTEAKNLQGNQFTASRLTELLSRHPANDPTRLIRSIQVFYNDFIEQGPASDDITLLALQYLPTHPAYLKHTTMQCTITINNELTELAQVRKRLGEILLQENISKSIIEDMQLVVEELLVNIIEYAFTDTTSTQQLINVHLNITETAVSFKFEDSGKPFNPLEEVTTPDLSVSAEERTNGGLGFFLVRKLVDHIHYARQEDKNVLLVSRNTANPT